MAASDQAPAHRILPLQRGSHPQRPPGVRSLVDPARTGPGLSGYTEHITEIPASPSPEGHGEEGRAETSASPPALKAQGFQSSETSSASRARI
jgi:hypothetical protein